MHLFFFGFDALVNKLELLTMTVILKQYNIWMQGLAFSQLVMNSQT
jgi:hypothetical protein